MLQIDLCFVGVAFLRQLLVAFSAGAGSLGPLCSARAYLRPTVDGGQWRWRFCKRRLLIPVCFVRAALLCQFRRDSSSAGRAPPLLREGGPPVLVSVALLQAQAPDRSLYLQEYHSCASFQLHFLQPQARGPSLLRERCHGHAS